MSEKMPGADAMTKAMEQARSSAEDFARMFADMKLPPIPGNDALLAAYKRNMEALTAANRVAMEGAQAIARRHMELMQQTISELTESLQVLTTSEAPQDKAAKQAELLKRAYERALSHSRDLGALIQSSNTEAVTVLNSRFTEAMEEVRSLVHKASAGS